MKRPNRKPLTFQCNEDWKMIIRWIQWEVSRGMAVSRACERYQVDRASYYYRTSEKYYNQKVINSFK